MLPRPWKTRQDKQDKSVAIKHYEDSSIFGGKNFQKCVFMKVVCTSFLTFL